LFGSAIPKKTLRVLVVDDFHPMADALVSMLNGCGHEARAAYDGREALRIAADFRQHAIISDVRMPEMNGFELAQAVAERFPDCCMLLMSVRNFESPLEVGGRLMKVLTKPVNLTQILEFLETCGA
jgi:CheY-like chemotaxis protein